MGRFAEDGMEVKPWLEEPTTGKETDPRTQAEHGSLQKEALQEILDISAKRADLLREMRQALLRKDSAELQRLAEIICGIGSTKQWHIED